MISMQAMFCGAISFNQSIADWDTSNVHNMLGMFAGATSFNQAVGGWDTSNVCRMGSMCEDATTFNQPLADWDTSHVKDMCGMFLNASSFNQATTGGMGRFECEIFGINVCGGSNFNQPLADWDISNVEVTYCMFENAHGSNQSLAALICPTSGIWRGSCFMMGFLVICADCVGG